MNKKKVTTERSVYAAPVCVCADMDVICPFLQGSVLNPTPGGSGGISVLNPDEEEEELEFGAGSSPVKSSRSLWDEVW